MTNPRLQNKQDAGKAGDDRPAVLVVEDHPDTVDWMASMVRHFGCRVGTASGGREALEIAQQLRPGLAFVDIGLPDLSGYEVARRIRRQPWGRDVFLAAVTGIPEYEDSRRSHEAGFDVLLLKPHHIKDMLAMTAGYCHAM